MLSICIPTLSCRVRPESFYGSTIDEIRGYGGFSGPLPKAQKVLRSPFAIVSNDLR